MKNTGKLILTCAVALLALTGLARAADDVGEGCSNATLKGNYAFTVSGTIFVPDAPPSVIQGVALTHFDGTTDANGNGNLSQVDFVVANPPLGPPAGGPPKFEHQETGTYHVATDCTGQASITFILSGKVNQLVLVVSSHGRKIHTVVSSLMITDPVSHAEVLVPAVIHSDAEKVE